MKVDMYIQIILVQPHAMSGRVGAWYLGLYMTSFVVKSVIVYGSVSVSNESGLGLRHLLVQVALWCK
jgi:hypothetical protein